MEEQFSRQLTACHVRLIYSPRFSSEVRKPKMEIISLLEAAGKLPWLAFTRLGSFGFALLILRWRLPV